MQVIKSFGKEDLAKVYIADFGDGRIAEFVESIQPPIPRQDKWVLIISTSFGCSVNCLMCDAGGMYKGMCTAQDMFEQIDHLIAQKYPDYSIPVKKFKVQFARMGEPAFNKSVLEVLEHMCERYNAPGLIPCISTIAPARTGKFFDRLLEIRHTLYSGKDFQLQFSLHSTDDNARDRLMPVPKWKLEQIAAYGEKFFCKGGRKITLNFALINGYPMDIDILARHFSPEYFTIKMTPVNPTYNAMKHQLLSYIEPDHPDQQNNIAEHLAARGFDIIISIGEVEENLIGSNCGQYVMKHLNNTNKLDNSYTYISQ